ncbi:MAG: hypothetical protein JWP01_1192 [Myxococcales bacterium]|nr:hypothetical protein [Myxococcales bacterium]
MAALVKKGPSDHARLVRAFDIAPTKRGLALTITTGFGAIGVLGAAFAFLPAAAAAAGLGAFALGDRRAIARGLRELDVWGFPIVGYRAWLLADEPTFDVELRRAVELQILVTSATAIDPAIAIRRINERSFRIVTRRIALPATKEGATPTYLGDRRLLRELYDRILGPLHADVGIVTMQMGDRATLPELAPSALTDGSEQPAVHGMGVFRDQAFAAPPALQSLVHSGTTSLALTQDAGRLPSRSLRVLFASGRAPAGAALVGGITFGGAIFGAQLGVAGMGVGTIGGFIGGVAAAITANRRNAKATANLIGWHGFEIENYDIWLLSGRPMFDIEIERPADRDWLLERLQGIVAYSAEAKRNVAWVEDVTWLEDRIVRIETRPTLIHPSTSKIPPFYGGSHVLFQHFLHVVLIPLHAASKISIVRMGGHVDRRV